MGSNNTNRCLYSHRRYYLPSTFGFLFFFNFKNHFCCLENLSDSSSSSYDVKAQQLGNSAKSSPSPPTSSVPIMFKKNFKTPLHDPHCGSVPNAALVPQTDIQPRYQQRRRRNSSSSNTGTRRPGRISMYFILDKDYH
jgi:hypothetical protein